MGSRVVEKLPVATIVFSVLALAISGWALWRVEDTSAPKPTKTTTSSSGATTTTAALVVVPDETNKVSIVAADDLTKHGLQFKIDRKPSTSTPRDKVISQDPSQGTRVARGTVVKLLVSSGPA